MLLTKLMTFTGLFLGLSVLTVAGPLLGEMIATMPPAFTSSVERSIRQSGLKFQAVSFPSSDGLTLRGWFFQAADPQAPAILYAPATAHDQRQGLSLVAPLQRAGYSVLLFSYRGHGRSDGGRFNFSYGARESQDIDAALRYLAEVRGIQRIGAIGHSAGAVALILSAARNPRLAAVVAAAPFTSVEDIWQNNRPAAFPRPFYALMTRLFEWRKGFSRQQVRPLDVIGKIAPRPLLLVHGLADSRITASQASDLYQAAGFPKQIIWLPGATHAQVRSPGLDGLAGQLVHFFDASLRELEPQLGAAPDPLLVVRDIPIEE